MLAKNKKTRKQGKWQSVVSPVLLGIFLAAAVWFLVSSNLQMNQKRAGLVSRVEELKKEIELLSERNKQLKASLSRAGSDDRIEEILYEQLGYKKSGEESIVIVPPSDEKEEETETPKEKGFWENLLEKVGL